MRRLFIAITSLALAIAPALAQFGPGGGFSGGGGGGGGGGGVTSFQTTCPPSGPSTGAVSLGGGLTPVARNPVSGATDTILSGDCGESVEYTDTVPVAVTVPQAGSAGFLSGFTVNVIAKSSTIVLTTTTSIFSTSGTTSFSLSPGNSATLQSDGTNWNVYTVKTNTHMGIGSYPNAAGNFFGNPYITATATSAVGVQFSYYCTPFWIAEPVHIEGFAIRVVTGSSGNNIAGAIYADLVTTGNVHRPGTFIDNTGTAFLTTTSAATVTAATTNASDALTGPALYWTCIQKNDATATYLGSASTNGLIAGVIGSATNSSVISSYIEGVSTTGTVFNSWANFTSSTVWTELTGNNNAPDEAIEIFSQP